MNVKNIAVQVADGLPLDATLEDLFDFLQERSWVEEGRDDFVAGQTFLTQEILQDAPSASKLPHWSQSAASAVDALRRNMQEHHPDVLASFERGLLESITRIASGTCKVISLPEMGDTTVLETRFNTGSFCCRIVFDKIASFQRILLFSTGTSRYRNCPPRPDETWKTEPWPIY